VNSTLTFVAKIAVLPLLVVGYVGVMGTTGTCPTCQSMVDWTLGRSAAASTQSTAGNAPAVRSVPSSSPPASSGPVHAIALPDLQGGVVSLGAYAGRPMLIEVWATWCGPCRTLRSRIESIAPRLREKATLVAVSVDQGGAAVVSGHLAGRPTPFVELMTTPEFRELLRPLDKAGTIPKLVYVDAQGNIAGLEHGVADPKWIEARIDALR